MDQASPAYDRSAHDAACPCKLCIAYDVLYAKEVGKVSLEPGALASYLERQRALKLNWDFEPGHCILCAGTSMNAWLSGEHFQIRRYNEKEVDRRWMSSLLLHKKGPMIAVYRHYLQKSGPFNHGDPKATLIKWVCNLLNLNPTYAIGIASRELNEEWFELRVGFTQLVEETREDRIGRQSVRGEGQSTDSSASTEGIARPV